MKTLYFLIILAAIFRTPSANAEGFDPYTSVRDLPGFSASIPKNICKNEFPFFKAVPRILQSGDAKIPFDVFAFTSMPFDAKKESILVIHGGPGGVWNAKGALRISKAFSAYNAVFFHYRGAGCSSFPSSPLNLDIFIDSMETISDIERIRNSFKIARWKAVVGFSYGTSVARRYAHFKPESVQSLILEGLSGNENSGNSSAQKPSSIENQHVLEKLTGRYSASTVLQKYVTLQSYQNFLQQIARYLQEYPAVLNYSLLGFWDSYKDLLEKSYLAKLQKMPPYLNRQTFAAITALVYANSDENSDYYILSLLDQFGYVSISEEVKSMISKNSESLTFMFFSFLNPNYLDYFKRGQLVSLRVQLAMTKNDKNISEQSICTNVQTLVINGAVDVATPVSGVEDYLRNKACAQSEENRALIVEGGGHSNLASMICLQDFANKFINNEKNELNSIVNCTLPVKLKKY